ncbi:MAG TPA: hypothetical protein VJH03_07435 [Blastocatellia bacterium]|nr:hypothetical protein [Blastocatellia bacterium]
MKRHTLITGSLLILALLVPGLALAGKVKKKNGQVIEGEIEGTLVQKGRGWQLKDGATVEHVNSYLFVGSKDYEIDSIDESGVSTSYNGWYLLLVVGSRSRMLSDAAVFRSFKSELERAGLDPEAFSVRKLASGLIFAVLAYPAHKMDQSKLVVAPIIGGVAAGTRGSLVAKKAVEIQGLMSGRFQGAPSDKQPSIASWPDSLIGELKDGQLIQAVRVKTSEGTVTIPVKDIVAFNQ